MLKEIIIRLHTTLRGRIKATAGQSILYCPLHNITLCRGQYPDIALGKWYHSLIQSFNPNIVETKEITIFNFTPALNIVL